MLDFVAEQKAEEKNADKAGVSTFFYVSAYEDLIIAEPDEFSEHSRLVPSLVIVLHGADWLNFINGLLSFEKQFPDEVYQRLYSYAFTLKDESNDLSDLTGR